MNHEMSALALCITALLASGCDHANAQPAHHRGPTSPASTDAGRANAAPPTAPRVAITIGEQGYQPASVTVVAGQPTTLVFTRTTDHTCGQQVVFPALGIRRDLPLNQPVEIVVTPAAGTITFTCGMDMMRGSVVAR